MNPILDFKFTHIKRSTKQFVGVTDCSEGRVFFAQAANGTIFSLKLADFNKRYFAI